MAKQITLTKIGGKAAFADGGFKLSKSIQIDKIEEHREFRSLFKIEETLLERITDSMIKDGYDNSQPLHIWVTTDENGTVHNYLIDGYTRWKALKKAGFDTAPYYEHKFSDFESAYKYVLCLQVNRRNLANDELLRNVSKLLETSFIKKTKGKTSESIADVLGIGTRTVERAINVIKNADEETKQKIADGEMSINQASKKTNKKTDDKISDALTEGNDGNSAGLNFSHSDGMAHGADERFAKKLDPENEADLRVIENRKIFLDGCREGYEKGFSDVAYSIFTLLIGMVRKGKSADEIERDEIFDDFSYHVLSEKLGIGYVEKI